MTDKRRSLLLLALSFWCLDFAPAFHRFAAQLKNGFPTNGEKVNVRFCKVVHAICSLTLILLYVAYRMAGREVVVSNNHLADCKILNANNVVSTDALLSDKNVGKGSQQAGELVATSCNTLNFKDIGTSAERVSFQMCPCRSCWV